MNKIVVAIILLWITGASAVSGVLYPTMETKDSAFTLTLFFTTTLPKEKLMEVLFTYDHTKKYVKQPNLKITLLRENERDNLISYHYNYIVASLDMAIENRISEDFRHCIFAQTDYRRSNKLIPIMISSGGRYDIVKTENGVSTVKYTQTGKMDQKISGVFAKVTKMESVGFIKTLLKYIDSIEKQQIGIQKR